MENGGLRTPSITLKKQSALRRFLNSLDFLQVVVGVLVGHVGGADVQLEVGPKVLKVVVVWKFWRVESEFSLFLLQWPLY